MGIEVFKKHLKEKRGIVISTGVDNFDLRKIAKISKAAQAAKASAIDIPANKDIYNTVKKYAKLPIMVSTYHPFQALECAKWGVEAIKIGNYEPAYKKGHFFNIDEIYDICLETLSLTNNFDVFTCVTIPGYIKIEDQIKLAKKLQILGIDLIQTECFRRTETHLFNDAKTTIENTYELTNNTLIPIMAASGMNIKTAPIAFSSGASATAFGTVINKLESEVQMATMIMQIVNSISHRNSLYKEIVKSERELSMI